MQVRVKVPNHESLMFFKERWQGNPFFGEFELPMINDMKRICSVDEKMISHMINRIEWNTYDKKTNTVVIDIDFVGPMGSLATSCWLKGDIRFAPRTLLVKKQRRIITWDLVHRPMDIGTPNTPPKTQQQVDIEGRTQEVVNKLQKEIINSDEGGDSNE